MTLISKILPIRLATPRTLLKSVLIQQGLQLLLICVSLVLSGVPGFWTSLGVSIRVFIDISQLQAILSKWPTAVMREDLACHDEVTRIAFCEQSIKFSFTHSRSFHGFQFPKPSPIGFVPQIHAPMFDCGFEDRRVIEICDAIKNDWTTVCFHSPAWAYVLFRDLDFWRISE